MAAATENNIIWGTGRRKSAVARVRLIVGTGKYTVNGKDGNEYFNTPNQQKALVRPFEATELEGKYDVLVNVHGGGPQAQAEAVLLGVSRCLLKLNSELGPMLKEHGLLTRDPRMKERKKYGLHGARKGTQFSKR